MDFPPVTDSPLRFAALLISAFAAGALNAVAGGGSFLTFPALLFSGVPPIAANATSAVALWPGSMASAVAYRQELAGARRTLVWLGIASLIGGTLGGWLLLKTPQRTFSHAVPFLMLIATLAFTFGDRLTRRLRGRVAPAERPRNSLLGPTVAQFVISIYGGYFGGGMGIVMLALFSFLHLRNIHQMNALKSVLAVILNGAAIVLFALSKAVAWKPGLVMAGGAIAGGYFGAAVARSANPKWIRALVIVIAWGLTAYFFLAR